MKPEKTRYEGTSFAVKAGAVLVKVEVMHPTRQKLIRELQGEYKESVDERIEVPRYGKV